MKELDKLNTAAALISPKYMKKLNMFPKSGTMDQHKIAAKQEKPNKLIDAQVWSLNNFL